MLTHNMFSGLYSDVGEYLRDEVSPLSIPSMPPGAVASETGNLA